MDVLSSCMGVAKWCIGKGIIAGRYAALLNRHRTER
jgi:hypothetical protein